MSACCVTDAYYPPQYSKRFTSFAAQLVLHSGAAFAGEEHLPCQVALEVVTIDTHFDYIDSVGVLVALTFPAVGLYVLRMAPVSIETTTNIRAVTVFWTQKG